MCLPLWWLSRAAGALAGAVLGRRGRGAPGRAKRLAAPRRAPCSVARAGSAAARALVACGQRMQRTARRLAAFAQRNAALTRLRARSP